VAHITIRKWLKENGYNDVLSIIDEIIIEWQQNGKQTRRNWWEILAGDKNGNSANKTLFPVLSGVYNSSMECKLDKGCHSTYSLRFHYVCCVKYRRKVLTPEVSIYLKARGFFSVSENNPGSATPNAFRTHS